MLTPQEVQARLFAAAQAIVNEACTCDYLLPSKSADMYGRLRAHEECCPYRQGVEEFIMQIEEKTFSA